MRRITAGTLATVVVATTMVGCSTGGGPVTLTLEADGTGDQAEVSYRDEDGPVTETVDLPWSVEVDLDGDWVQELVVTNLDGRGTVECTVTEDGFPEPVSTAGEAAARCRAARQGDGVEWETEGTEFDAAPAGAAGSDSGDDDDGDAAADVVTLTLDDPPFNPDRSQGEGGELWALDGTEVVAVDLATGEVRRIGSSALVALDTLGVGSERLAVIAGDGSVHAGRTAGDGLAPVTGLGEAIHLAVARDLFWATTEGPRGVALQVVDPGGRVVATFQQPGTAPAVIADTGTAAFAIDLDQPAAYFLDLEEEGLTTVSLPEGAQIAWAVPISGREVLANDTAGALVVISAAGDSELILPDGVERVWADEDTGTVVVEGRDGTFARFDPETRTVGDPVALPGDVGMVVNDVAAAAQGTLWFWADGYEQLVGVDLATLG